MCIVRRCLVRAMYLSASEVALAVSLLEALYKCSTLPRRWLGIASWLGRRTSDRKIKVLTPGRCVAGYSLGQLSLPSLRGR